MGEIVRSVFYSNLIGWIATNSSFFNTITVHCWDYRNLISAKLKRTVEQELEFSLQKIQQNLSAFSYSTLFYRSSIYIKGAKEKQIDLTEHWDREYSLIENALFTEPNDQALWFYLRWLLATNFGRNLNATIDASSFITSGSYQKLELLRIVNQSRTGLLIFHFNMNVLSDVLGELQVQMQKTSSKWHRVDCHGDSTLRKIVIYKVGSDRIKKIKMKVTGLEMELDLKSITSNLSIWTNSQVQTLEKPVTNIRSEQLQNLMSLKEFEPNNKCKY